MIQRSPHFEKVGDLVSIFQRGDVWYANFQTEGKQRRQSLKTRSKKEARRRALLIEAALIKGEYQQAARAPRLEKVNADYLAHLRTDAAPRKRSANANSRFKRLASLGERHHIHSIRQVDLKLIDAYRAERVAAEAGPKTVHNETVIIRQLVNFALARGMIKDDPLKGLKLKKPKPTRQPCWTWDEVDCILAAANGHHLPVLVLLAETGTRIGELQFLTWDDIDFANSLIHIRPKDDWQPKTGDQRVIPMSLKARATLEKLPRHGRWVLTAKASARFPKADRQISERRSLQYLKRVLKRLGLRATSTRFGTVSSLMLSFKAFPRRSSANGSGMSIGT